MPAPALIGLFGPLKGSTFPITAAEVTIGRDKSNWLSIPDPQLSRQHCVIQIKPEVFRIVDLNSRNGIFVNGIPSRERELEDGDQIEMGDSLFLFVLQDEAQAVPAATEDGAFHSTLTLKIEDALYLKPASIKESPRSNQDLKALLAAAMAIHSIQDHKRLCAKMLELLVDTVPADSGVIVLIHAPGELVVGGSFRKDGSSESPSFNSGIVQKALDLEEALIAGEGQTVLCAPMLVFKKKLGVIYLSMEKEKNRFRENDLQLLTGMASLCAVALNNVRQMEQLTEENARLQRELTLPHSMVGESDPMRRVFELISKVSPADSTVLISGESGTGKELAARAIHQNSRRAVRPFVAINCAALVEPLLESELFGHEKGAFTGAIQQKKGKLEVADGGTLFLDEVSEMSLPLQAKFLRFLQEREFERVGGTRPIRVDIRVIAASNRNLEDAIQSGSFRNDLFFRLNVVNLRMPALRDRRVDIPLLSNYFAARHGRKIPRRLTGISPAAMNLLVQHDWPGNVRELENMIERAIVLGSGEEILPEDLPENLFGGSSAAPPAGFQEVIIQTKKRVVLDALARAGGVHAEAAKLLGLHPNYLYRLLRNLGIDEP